MENDYTLANVQYVLNELIGRHSMKRKVIADALGIKGGLSRYINGQRPPRNDVVKRLSYRTRIDFPNFAKLPTVEFKQKYSDVKWLSDNKPADDRPHEMSIDFQCIIRKEDYLKQCFAQHHGSYLMFTQQTHGAPLALIDIHLLTIHNYTTMGLQFNIFRRFDHKDERLVKGSVWNKFTGLMFDIEGFPHFFGEGEIEHDMITFITDRLPERTKNEVVSGYMLSVKRGRPPGAQRHQPICPMAWKVALLYISRQIISPNDVSDTLGRQLRMDQLKVSIREHVEHIFNKT